jgi:acetyl-CoA acyltransferase
LFLPHSSSILTDETHFQEARMTRQIQEAYIVAATRTPVGKAPRGMFRNTRPDDLLAHVLRSVLLQCPDLEPGAVQDR